MRTSISSAQWKSLNQKIWSSFRRKITPNGILLGLRAVAPPACAALTFELTLLLYQGAGRVIGVSCASPVLGPMLGCVAVASASMASAKVSETLTRLSCTKLKVETTSFWSNRLFLHAVLGVIAFKVLGGSCRNVMPSSVIHPGALARRSIPARGSRYANELEGDLINDLYMEYGCHHCGNRRGKSIADHMPPNAIANSKTTRSTHITAVLMDACDRIKFFSRSWNNPLQKPYFSPNKRQRLYPQCQRCMFYQSEALRHKKKITVFHFKSGFPEHLWRRRSSYVTCERIHLLSWLACFHYIRVSTLRGGSASLFCRLLHRLHFPSKLMQYKRGHYTKAFYL